LSYRGLIYYQMYQPFKVYHPYKIQTDLYKYSADNKNPLIRQSLSI